MVGPEPTTWNDVRLRLLHLYYSVRLPGIGACLQTKRKAPGAMEKVMINRPRYRKMNLDLAIRMSPVASETAGSAARWRRKQRK